MEILFIVGTFILVASVTVLVIVKETKERNQQQADFDERLRAHSPIEGKF